MRSAVADPAFVTGEMVAGYARPRRVRDWDRALLGIVRDGNANALPAPVSTIQAPTLLIWGAEDTRVPPQAGERLHASMALARPAPGTHREDRWLPSVKVATMASDSERSQAKFSRPQRNMHALRSSPRRVTEMPCH